MCNLYGFNKFLFSSYKLSGKSLKLNLLTVLFVYMYIFTGLNCELWLWYKLFMKRYSIFYKDKDIWVNINILNFCLAFLEVCCEII